MFRPVALLILALAAAPCARADAPSAKLIQTGGVTQVEGAGGGGLTPWALITGYGVRGQVGANAHTTQIRLRDVSFDSNGAAVGIDDRVELSFAEQRLHLDAAGQRLGLGPDFALRQQIAGVKVRVWGDAIYYQDTWAPQVSVGAQFKQADHGALLRAVGATDDSGVDYYLALTKLLLAQSFMYNLTLRSTDANQMGLLGFGGDRRAGRSLEVEASAVYLVSRHVAVGAEYRTNPDNRTFARADAYRDVFVALSPSKNFSLTFGYADLGSIAGFAEQEGAYLSVQGGF